MNILDSYEHIFVFTSVVGLNCGVSGEDVEVSIKAGGREQFRQSTKHTRRAWQYSPGTESLFALPV